MPPLFEIASGAARCDQHRTVVFAYDVRCSRRSFRVRRALQTVQTAAQYSVFETWLTPTERRDLLAELTSHMEMNEDRLAVWSPCKQTRVEVRKAKARSNTVRVVSRASITRCGDSVLAESWAGCGNSIVCYDIRDVDRLRAVAAAVASVTVAVQRSVYWLRAGWKDTNAIIRKLGELLDDDDSLWIYPLAHAGDLWRIQPSVSAMLPIGTEQRFDKR